MRSPLSIPGLSTHVALLIRKRVEVLASEAEDPEAIHDRRVAIRRLRVICELFQPLAPDLPLRRCLRRLKELGEALSPVREWDVNGELLEAILQGTEDGVGRAALEHLLEWAALARRRALKKARAVLGAKELRALRVDLLELAAAMEGLLEDVAGPAYAWSCVHPAFQGAFGNLAALSVQEEAEGLHEARIQLKRLRYTLECFEPAFQDGFQDLLGRTRQLQDALGTHHDHVVLGEFLRIRCGALEERGRMMLALGLRPCLEQVEARRVELFEAFRRAIPKPGAEELAQALWYFLAPVPGKEGPEPVPEGDPGEPVNDPTDA